MQRKSVGRPPIPKAQRHHRRVVVLLTDAEWRRLKGASKGTPLGVYARYLVLAALEGERK